MVCLGVDARELTGHPAGKGQYLLRLLKQWQTDPDVQLVLYVSAGSTLEFTGATIIAQKGGIRLWHRAVAHRLQTDGVELFLAALSYQSAIWNRVPTLTVVHDLVPFKVEAGQVRRRSLVMERLALRRCLKRSAAVVAVSKHTRNDLLELTDIEPGKVQVIGEAAMLERVAKPLGRAKRQATILSVGTLEPRKNIPTLLKAFALLPKGLQRQYTVQIVGKDGWGRENYPRLATTLGIAARVQFLGYVDDPELAKLYRQATLFVFPSFYEGFGLPVLEAMSAGTPVLASNRSSLPEVVGEAGVLCDPTDDSCFSEQMTALLTDTKLWQQYSQAGFKRSQAYRWDSIASEMKEVLKKINPGKS